MREKNPVVYSTEWGRICPRCAQPESHCVCKTQRDMIAPPADGLIRVRREKKGRGGKEVTLIRGLSGSADEIRAHVTALKKQLGTGGAYKDGLVEIQGDRVDQVLQYFSSLGRKAKKDGG